jgi:Bifunctional DNA primase/polymerase, N-terminal
MTNISRPDIGINPHAYDVRRDWAAWWIALGTRVFLVIGGTKKPYGNCSHCDFVNGAPRHDLASCPCLLCHSFHAATDDLDRFAAMLAQAPDGDLAIPTKRIVVLDVESDDRLHPGQPYGVDVLDHWDEWTHWELAPTLTATTPSGGFHLYYASDEHVPTGRCPLPNIEVKGNGGLVVVPPSPGRRLTRIQPIAPMQPELLQLVRTARGGNGGSGYVGAAGGGDVLPPTEELETYGLGPPGIRNRRAYRLAFRLWAQGCDEHEVAGSLKRAWDATTNQIGSSWSEIWRTSLSARRRHHEALITELAPYQPFIDEFLGA